MTTHINHTHIRELDQFIGADYDSNADRIDVIAKNHKLDVDLIEDDFKNIDIEDNRLDVYVVNGRVSRIEIG